MQPHQRSRPETEAPVLRLRRPADLVEAVPYLLGFHPRRSVVLVGLRPGSRSAQIGQVGVTIRLDTADLACDAQGAASRLADDAARGLAGAGASRVIGVVFADAGDDPEECGSAMQRATRSCVAMGLEVLAFLGPEPPSDLAGVVAAQATYAGLVARPDRAALVALLEPEATAVRERHRSAVWEALAARSDQIAAGGRGRLHRSTMRALYAATRTLTLADDRQLSRFGAALTDVAIRDACWLAIEAGRLDGEGLWRELAQRLPPPYDAAPLFLFGWIRWRAGDGALAGIAVQRSLASDPDYRAAGLLDSALRQGLDPFRTPRLRRGA